MNLDPLDTKIISKDDIIDLNKPYVKGFMTIYSMEIFLYKNLNYAARTNDKDKFVSLGPISYVLDRAIRA